MPGKEDPPEPGARGDSVREAVGVFHDAEIMETAIDELLSSGFDRTEISLLAGEQAVEERLGHRFDDVRELEDDPAAPRRRDPGTPRRRRRARARTAGRGVNATSFG